MYLALIYQILMSVKFIIQYLLFILYYIINCKYIVVYVKEVYFNYFHDILKLSIRL